jgi:hypothetical protein
MADPRANPHFYNVTLSPPQSISHAIVGSFSGIPKSQEIIVARGTRLELLKPDASTGTIETVLESEVFGTIRSLAGFKLTGGNKGSSSLGLPPSSLPSVDVSLRSRPSWLTETSLEQRRLHHRRL